MCTFVTKCTVLRSTHGFKFYACSVLALTHGTTRLPEISQESMCFQWTPSDDFPTLLKVLFTLLVMTKRPVTQVDSTVLPFHFSIGLHRTPGLSTGIQSRVLDAVSFLGRLWKVGLTAFSFQFLFGGLKENQCPGSDMFLQQKAQGTPSLCFYVQL